ncbi:30S ribosomal protein S4 [Candidatus Pacearchaeota archaeon]|nr:30S ribosomal protein S4 [Candidatus Pacearchaeota archaeon]
MKRKHKSYSRPKRPFDKGRIDEENIIREKFGLKTKREIWKAEARVKKIRERAKSLISSSDVEQKKLFDQLSLIGLKVSTIPEVLSLTKEDYLTRRLQTVLVKKRLTTTMKAARQLITHKKVLVDGKIVSVPSYVVPVNLEEKISLRVKKKAPKKQEESKDE